MNIIKVKDVQEMKLIDSPCVYFLTDSDGEVLYIGKSRSSIIGRIAAHSYDKQFSRAFFIKCRGFNDMDNMEAELIKKFIPKYNLIIPAGNEVAGLIRDDDIKRKIKVDKRIIYNASKKYDVSMVAIGCRRYYDKGIYEAIDKYLKEKGKGMLSYRIK